VQKLIYLVLIKSFQGYRENYRFSKEGTPLGNTPCTEKNEAWLTWFKENNHGNLTIPSPGSIELSAKVSDGVRALLSALAVAQPVNGKSTTMQLLRLVLSAVRTDAVLAL
jgi:hypothetical protein